MKCERMGGVHVLVVQVMKAVRGEHNGGTRAVLVLLGYETTNQSVELLQILLLKGV